MSWRERALGHDELQSWELNALYEVWANEPRSIRVCFGIWPFGDYWRGQSDLFQGDNFQKNLEKVEELKKFAEERHHTVAQLAVAWTLANPAVDVAIFGARRPDHIEGTAPAAEFDLSEDNLREIDNLMPGAVMHGRPSLARRRLAHNTATLLPAHPLLRVWASTLVSDSTVSTFPSENN